jgi:hypothetical protein
MGKRRSDAGGRRFFDEFMKVRVSRFRADGTIDPAKSQAVIPFPDGSRRLLGVKHRWFKKGGGWSFFVCPGCGNRTPTLYLVDQAPRCFKCCDAMNIKHASKWGFGRGDRRRASDGKLDELIAKLETNEPLRLKPTPKSWQGKAKLVYGNWRLTERMRRRTISLRLQQLAADYAMKGERLKISEPFAAAKQLIDLTPIQRAKTTEQLEQALDQAQNIIIAALSSDNPQQRLNAASLMLRTKQARDRGLA